MLTTQLKAIFVLIILFLTVAIAAKAIGSFQPINPALRGFIEGCEDKPQPCWYGIMPGVTTLEEARNILEKLGYTLEDNLPLNGLEIPIPPDELCIIDIRYFPYGDRVGKISALLFYQCPNLTYFDMLAALGRPDAVVQVSEPISLWYVQGRLEISDWNWAKGPAPVRLFLLFHQNPSVDIVHWEASWHGFVPRWRYCQFEPEFGYCSYQR
jgi:hypothetical protein